MSQEPSLDSQIEAFKKMVDKIFDEAKSKALSTLNEAAEKVVSTLEESERFSINRCQEILSTYHEKAEIESRKEISRSEVEARMNLLNLRESYVERAFKEARSRLVSYCDTEEYISDLVNNLKKLSKAVPVGEILMREKDIKRIGLGNLKKIFGKDLQIKPHPIDIGGFIIVSADKKIFLDRTFESILSEERHMLRSRVASILFG
ncbi:MAG: V-type ATP synthase subunit E family protein [Candidatus Methanomethyliaceae archaeon]|nr:V-type ATP synthase subunit E family protein [Candidatus Methanomethyliaceae archaeon]